MTKLKLAVGFPGQGSQYVGMGRALEDTPVYHQACQVLGDINLSEIISGGPEEKLQLTAFTQPALAATSVAWWTKLTALLTSFDQSVDIVMGHSVGEYSALYAAGVLTIDQLIQGTHLRGKSMQDATPVGQGQMVAVLRAELEQIEKGISECAQNEVLVIANDNSPGQVVVSGHAGACERLSAWFSEQPGRVRTVKLNVSAPFHCPLMKPAEDAMANFFDSTPVSQNSISYIDNYSASLNQAGSAAGAIQELLIQQICGRVRWRESFAKLDSDTVFIECGPGKVLSGLAKRINPEIQTFAVDDGGFDAIQAFLEEKARH